MAVRLQVAGVGKDFLIPVIDSVSFAVESGEFVCVLGPNGCGKTTLLRIVGGLEPPTRGHVLLGGEPVSGSGRHTKKVGVVFQEDRLLPWLTLRQNVALVLEPLAIEPDLLLMDEPFGALDAQNRRIMQAEVRRIWRETGRTILFVTHAIDEAVAIGTTLIMLSARPARIRAEIRNDGRVERGKLIDDLNTLIMEEVERQQGTSSIS